MTLRLSENIWAKSALVLVGLALVLAAWAYIAGGIFLTIYGRNFQDASPMTLYQYWYFYGTKPDVEKWIYVSIGGALALLLAPFLVLLSPAKQSLFGDARFARKSEIRKAGLLGNDGLIVGKLGSEYLTFDGQQHAIISAPTRGGKGVGIVIPNLLHWPGSVVVLDIKQENWDITSGYRAKYGQECFLFNPMATDYRTHRYNALAYISNDPNFRIDDIQKIANMLFPDQAGTDVIWTATPRSLFLGIVLYLAESPNKLLTLGQVLRETLADGDGSAHFTAVINDRAAAGNPLSSACVRALNSYISISSENTRAGVMTSFRSRLELWMNPLIDAATSANDFDLREIRKKRMSIYIGVTPDNLERVAPLLNLFFQQLIDLNTRELPSQNKALKYSCLLLMDEFTAIGKIGTLSKGISYIAGYNLRMMPIIQSPSQLVDVYGKEAAQTFTVNHALNIVFPPKASETDTAKDISEWLGYQTVKGISESKAKGFGKRTPTESHSDQRRALMLPQEITGLGQGRELVIMENLAPVLARKVQFFKDPAFVDRLKEVSPSLKRLGSRLPTRHELDTATRSGELRAFVPLLDIEAHHAQTGEGSAPVAPKTEKTLIRPVVASDVPKLAKMGLSQFEISFSSAPKVHIEPGTLDEELLSKYADIQSIQAGLTVAA